MRLNFVTNVRGIKRRLRKLKRVGSQNSMKKAFEEITLDIFDQIEESFDVQGPGWKPRSLTYIRTQQARGNKIGFGLTRQLTNFPNNAKGNSSYKVQSVVRGGEAQLTIASKLPYAGSFNDGRVGFIPLKGGGKAPFRQPRRRFVPTKENIRKITKIVFDSIIEIAERRQ